MDYETFSQFIGVPRETHLRLSRYVELLEEWGGAINLVSRHENLWQRHIIDCAQITGHIDLKSDQQIVDMGSGGGLPGIVLAIMMPNPILLIESDRRKSLFLKHCIQELKLPHAEVENKRIKEVEAKAKMVTARALASLDELLHYASSFLEGGATCLFPKGKNYDKECEEAERNWDYEKEIIPSLSGEGALLRLRRIKRKVGTS